MAKVSLDLPTFINARTKRAACNFVAVKFVPIIGDNKDRRIMGVLPLFTVIGLMF